MKRVFVQVMAVFDPDGQITPTHIVWEDGRIYGIDRILDVRKAASLKTGGQGMRYTIKVLGKIKYLFYEEPRWFLPVP